MKRNKGNRIVFAWLLSVIFVIPLISKTVHFYENDHSENNTHTEHHAKHDCNNCQVCQFTLSSFSEVEPAILKDTPIVFCVEIVTLYKKRGNYLTTTSCYLRAPPVCG